MKNQLKDAQAATASIASKSSADVDIRCAISLAKVALQVMADLHPESAAAIDHGLAAEIKAAQLKPDPDSLAVVEILSEVRARLAGEEPRPLLEDDPWYIA